MSASISPHYKFLFPKLHAWICFYKSEVPKLPLTCPSQYTQHHLHDQSHYSKALKVSSPSAKGSFHIPHNTNTVRAASRGPLVVLHYAKSVPVLYKQRSVFSRKWFFLLGRNKRGVSKCPSHHHTSSKRRRHHSICSQTGPLMCSGSAQHL